MEYNDSLLHTEMPMCADACFLGITYQMFHRSVMQICNTKKYQLNP